jgi:hypothetical protein
MNTLFVHGQSICCQLMCLPLGHTVMDQLGQGCVHFLTKWYQFLHTFNTRAMFNR